MILSLCARRLPLSPIRCFSSTLMLKAEPSIQKMPEKIEVFVDDIPVMVDPGTTVLQVDHEVNVE